jgi:hypothetical protein
MVKLTEDKFEPAVTKIGLAFGNVATVEYPTDTGLPKEDVGITARIVR